MDTNLRAEIDRLHAQVCNGLADPNRILILYTISENAYNVSDLAKTVELPQSTVSRHLKILRDRGMVTAQRDGQSVFYSLADDRIIQALELLDGRNHGIKFFQEHKRRYSDAQKWFLLNKVFHFSIKEISEIPGNPSQVTIRRKIVKMYDQYHERFFSNVPNEV